MGEKDDNHREETKDKAESDASKRERASRTIWFFPFVWSRDRPGRKSTRKAVHLNKHPLRFGQPKKNSSGLWPGQTEKVLPARYPN